MSGPNASGQPQLPTIITTPIPGTDSSSQRQPAIHTDNDDSGEISEQERTASEGKHSRNYSITNMSATAAPATGAPIPASPSDKSSSHPRGHARTASLQVPGTSVSGSGDASATMLPSSPTLSAASDFSFAESSGGTPQRTALALRDYDPNRQQQPLQHMRQTSIASVFTDVSADRHSKSSTVPDNLANGAPESSSPTSTHAAKSGAVHANGTGALDRSGPSQEADKVVAENASAWKKYKALLKGKTRAGRRAAQANELENERTRAREIDPAPFRIRPIELADLIDPKDVSKLRDLGGVDGLLASLGTDGKRGLDAPAVPTAKDTKLTAGKPADDIESAPFAKNEPRPDGFVNASSNDRERVYGRNVIPDKPSKSLLLLMWLALQDKILILLCIAAVVSLALGLYSDFGAPRELFNCPDPPPGMTQCPAPQVDWIEGVAILVAVAIVDIVGSLNDWQKERQFKVLNAKKEKRNVKVIRSGAPIMLSVHDVQVGDILELEPGEILPCDGVFLRGHNVKCDESGATGESDMIRKVTYEEALSDWDKHEQTGEKLPHRDCFLISGSRCLEGVGEYVVIAVGPTSFNGKVSFHTLHSRHSGKGQGGLVRLDLLISSYFSLSS